MCEEKVEKAFGVETRKDSQALFPWELSSGQWAVGEAWELKSGADMAKPFVGCVTSLTHRLNCNQLTGFDICFAKFSLKKNLKPNQQLEVN